MKEIEENNRMGETRDLFKKIRDTKEHFMQMGTIKDRNGMDLTEVEILRRGGKNTQKNYTRKDLHDPDNHNGKITYLKPDILEFKSSLEFIRNSSIRALGSITTKKAVEVM